MRKKLVFLVLFMFVLVGCSNYKTQYASFRPAEAYPNSQSVHGVTVGGEAYADLETAKKGFGFDIRGAGLLPVQVVLNNNSGKTLEIVAAQTFLVDEQMGYWNLLSNSVAVERVESATRLGAIASGAGKGTALGAVGGAILGAAIGIVSGRSIGEGVLRGGAAGGAAGAIIGGAKEGTSTEREHIIAHDIRDKGLEGKEIPSEALANGFLFFPGEALSAKELRLQIREKETGRVHNVNLKF